ncbi:MAG: nucleotide exchange factor GrpE [Desulfobulbaceae bacterium]
MTEEKEKRTIPVEEKKKSGDEHAEPVASDREQGESELEEHPLEKELADTQDRLLRLAAEFENYKKRVAREQETLVKYAGENILRELLATVDNLDRALEQGSADTEDVQQKLDSMLEGVELTRKGLLATLEKFEVVPLESVGGEFNPNEHEALTMEPSEEMPANHVLTEFVKGYRFKDRLLRPAKVVVSSGPAEK